MLIRFKGFSLLFSLVLLISPSVYCQIGQNSLDNFLDEDDFGDPMPFTPQPNYGGFQNQPAPPPPPPPAYGAPNEALPGESAKGARRSLPVPRRKRTEPPQLFSKRPASLADVPVESFNYRNVDINAVVKSISELTGRNFAVDPEVRGRLSIKAPPRISVAEAYKAFVSALAVNGLAIVPKDDFLTVEQGQNVVTSEAAITRVVRLRYTSINEAANYLRSYLKSPLAEIRLYEPANTLIISDYGSNIRPILKILRQFDVQESEGRVEIVRVMENKGKVPGRRDKGLSVSN